MRRFLEAWARYLKWFVLSLVIVPLFVGVGGHYLLRSYEATASIWVEASSASIDPTGIKTPAGLYVDQLQQLLLTRAFREEVLGGLIAHTGLIVQTPDQHEAMLVLIGTGTKVTARGANLFDVSVRNHDAPLATGTVAAVVEAFQAETVSLKEQATRRETSLYENQVQQARDDVVAAQNRLSVLRPSVPAAAQVQATQELQTRQDLLKALEDRQAEAYGQNAADLASAPSTLQVIDAPQVKGQAKTDWVDLALAVIGALVVTFAVDLGVITVLTLSDRSVHTAADLGSLTDAPVAEMPRVHALRDGNQLEWLPRRMLKS